jgi:hypothetical protein
MSVQDILDKKNEEIALIYQIITHPAGYILDLFGEMLFIRSTMYEFEVGWESREDNLVINTYKLFWDALEAVTFFVEKRHEMQLGVDFETELMRERSNNE